MERPSHINFRTSHAFSSRLALSGLALSLPLAVLWALTHDMVGQVIKEIAPLIVVPVDRPVKPRTPPPQLKMEEVVHPRAIALLITIAPIQNESSIIATVPAIIPRQDGTPTITTGPDRAAAGIQSTHTIPPYPPLAQRLGEEGKVTLRLTVLADGRVGKAEIVTSSGRNDLDQSAQDWIVAHWTYRPALEKGQPAVSQALATVIFSLSTQR